MATNVEILKEMHDALNSGDATHVYAIEDGLLIEMTLFQDTDEALASVGLS